MSRMDKKRTTDSQTTDSQTTDGRTTDSFECLVLLSDLCCLLSSEDPELASHNVGEQAEQEESAEAPRVREGEGRVP